MQVSVLAGAAAALLALVCPEVDCGTPVVCWHGINDNAARWKCPDMSSYPVSSKHLVSSIQTYHSCLVALGPWTGWRRRPPTPTPGPSWSGMTWTTTPPTVSSWAPTTRSGICGGGLAFNNILNLPRCCPKSLTNLKFYQNTVCEFIWIFDVLEVGVSAEGDPKCSNNIDIQKFLSQSGQ